MVRRPEAPDFSFKSTPRWCVSYLLTRTNIKNQSSSATLCRNLAYGYTTPSVGARLIF
jgi:hypothetical protein